VPLLGGLAILAGVLVSAVLFLPIDSQTRAILGGEASPHADLAYLNAGAAIYAAGRAGTLAEGVEAARGACMSGAAAKSLDAFVGFST